MFNISLKKIVKWQKSIKWTLQFHEKFAKKICELSNGKINENFILIHLWVEIMHLIKYLQLLPGEISLMHT